MSEGPTLSGDLKLLGFTAEWFQSQIKQWKTLREGEAGIKQIKEELKKKFRALSKEMHPDVGGDEKKFIAVREAYERLSRMRLIPKQPMTMPVQVVMQTVKVWTSAASTTTATGSSTSAEATFSGWFGDSSND
jgi:hypothetical protein